MPTPATASTDFVRFVEDAQGASLQTGIASYAKDGVVVDLVGAVHIADAAYFAALNQRFTGYDAVLYELVGPPVEQREKLRVGNGEKRLQGLGMLQDIMRKTLALESQLGGIDYRAKNFVHADMGTNQFFETQERKGESFLGLWWKAVKVQFGAPEGSSKSQQPGLAKVLEILCRKDSATELKRLVGREFDAVEQIVAGVEGADGTVIIGERNRVALEVLDREVKAGKKHLAIFYGAAHLPDMEKRLLARGYQRQAVDWLKAWDLPPEPKAGG